MSALPAGSITDVQFEMERQRIIEELVSRMNTVTSIAIITVDELGMDQIEVLGDLDLLRQLAALTTQNINAELSLDGATH